MPKVHLDRLRRRHGWTGGSYQALMDLIVAEAHESTARAVGRVKVRDLRDTAAKLARRRRQPAQLQVPPLEDVLPKRSVFIRKGVEQGELLSDSLRTKLSGELRKSVSEFLAEGGQAMQYQRGERRGRMKPELADRMEKRLETVFSGYSKSDPRLGVPPNVRAIAVTETRSAIDDIKATFTKRVLEKNPGAKATKRWVHNDHLVREPRPGHKALDGTVVDANKPFRVVQYRQAGTKSRGPNAGRPRWERTGTVVWMQHPHDPAAPPEEVINCACDVDYLFDIPAGGS